MSKILPAFFVFLLLPAFCMAGQASWPSFGWSKEKSFFHIKPVYSHAIDSPYLFETTPAYATNDYFGCMFFTTQDIGKDFIPEFDLSGLKDSLKFMMNEGMDLMVRFFRPVDGDQTDEHSDFMNGFQEPVESENRENWSTFIVLRINF